MKENWGGWLGEERPTTSILAVRFSRGLAQDFVSPSLISIVRVLMFTTSLMMTEEQKQCPTRVEICRDATDGYNCKIFVSYENFFQKAMRYVA